MISMGGYHQGFTSSDIALYCEFVGLPGHPFQYREFFMPIPIQRDQYVNRFVPGSNLGR